MKYKVIDYVSDVQEEQTGTCEVCFGTAMVEMVLSLLKIKTGRQLKFLLLGGAGEIILQSILIT